MALLSCATCARCDITDSANCNLKTKHRIFPTKSFVSIVSGVNIKCVKGAAGCTDGWHFFSGSGASVSYDTTGSLILTAGHLCHVGPPATIAKIIETKFFVNTYTSERLSAEVVYSVHTTIDDLCLLHVKGASIQPVKLSESGPEPGVTVYSMSAPGGRYYAPHPLLLSGLFSGNILGGNSALTSVPAIGGVSGGPILNTNMELVGVLFAVNLKFKHETLSSSYNNTRIFLYKAFKTYLNKIKSQ